MYSAAILCVAVDPSAVEECDLDRSGMRGGDCLAKAVSVRGIARRLALALLWDVVQ